MSIEPKYMVSQLLILIFFAYGCSAPPAIESETPSSAQTTTLPPTLEPTLTPKPISKDALLISYDRNEGGDGIDEMSSCVLGYSPYYRFVLYQDGHLIRFDETRYSETRISQAEIDKLLEEITATGFSSLIGDGDQYLENAPPPSFINPWEGSITVSEKTIAITAGQSDYLVEPVLKTIDIIENYRPNNLQPYAPETLALWVYLEENIRLGLASPTPEPPPLKWSMDEIDLDNLLTDLATHNPQVISGDSLAFVLQQLKYVPTSRWVEQNGKNYLVVLCPNFP